MKFLKWTVRLLTCLLLVAALVMFGPSLWRLLHLSDGAALSSTVLKEEMKEMGVLNSVNHTEIGELSAEKTAWLVGTAWRFSAPYSYSIDFGVDLDQATVDVSGDVISIGLPEAYMTSSNLEITGDVKTDDFWKLLSGKEYADALNRKKAEFEAKYATETELDNAWNVATDKLRGLLEEVTGGISARYTIDFALKG